MNKARSVHGAAFTLLELLVVIAVIALLISILLPGLGEARRTGQKAVCLSNMRQFGIGYASYASDFDDRIASFTWGENGWSKYNDLNSPYAPNNPLVRSADQAIDIIRRRTGRDDFPRQNGWIPQILYNHLVINDYLAQRLPEKMVVCPADKVRLGWQRDHQDPTQADIPAPSGRWAYSASYLTVPAAFSPDFGTAGPTACPGSGQSRTIYRTVQKVAYTGGSHHYWYGPCNTRLGERKWSNVRFPSQKVLMFDEHNRHFTDEVFYYGYRESRQPLLFFDASVRQLESNECNKGAWPNNLRWNGTPTQRYRPSDWEPATVSGRAFDDVPIWWVHTRGGLQGVDFDGEEVMLPD